MLEPKRGFRKSEASCNLVFFDEIEGEPHVLLIPYYRNIGGRRRMFFQLPGGNIENEDENPPRGAVREALEEVGFRPLKMIRIRLEKPYKQDHEKFIYLVLKYTGNGVPSKIDPHIGQWGFVPWHKALKSLEGIHRTAFRRAFRKYGDYNTKVKEILENSPWI